MFFLHIFANDLLSDLVGLLTSLHFLLLMFSIKIDGFGSCEQIIVIVQQHTQWRSDPDDLQSSPVFLAYVVYVKVLYCIHSSSP